MVEVIDIQDLMNYTPKQREFMYYAVEDEAVDEWGNRISDVYFVGGVRSGKSVSMVKAGWHLGMRYKESHGLLTRSTLRELKSATLNSTFFGKDADGNDIIPPGVIEKHDQDLQQIIFKNGSKISYFGMDQIERFQGMEFSYWLAEEANRYKINVFNYVRNTRICHRIGPHRCLYNSNTDTGQDHLYQRFFEQKNPGHKAIIVTTLENLKNLPENFRRELELMKQRDPVSYAVYIMAKFQGLSGLVYPQFNPIIHVVEPFDIPREWKKVKGFDHGFAHYCFGLQVALDFEGNLWCIDEYAEKNRSIPENSKALKEQKGWRNFEFADPSVAKQKTHSSVFKGRVVTIKQDYFDNGIDLTLANNSSAGIERIRGLLWVDPERIHPVTQNMGSPKIFFFRGRVPVLIRQIGNYKLKQNTDGLDTEQPEDGDEDGPDCLKYIVNGNPQLYQKGRPEEAKPDYMLNPWDRRVQAHSDPLSSLQ